MTFKEAVHFGTAKLEDIDDWICAWHNDELSDPTELFEYLGLTNEEYAQFVKSPETLKSIIGLP